MENETELYHKALKLWGTNAQINMLFEEMAELTKAICKVMRKPGPFGPRIDNIIEELADVEIMLGQMKVLFSCYEQVELLKVSKMERLSKLIERG